MPFTETPQVLLHPSVPHRFFALPQVFRSLAQITMIFTVRLQFWQVSWSYKWNAVRGEHRHFNVIFQVTKGLLLSVTSTSRRTSCSSVPRRQLLPIALYRACLMTPTKRSNCLAHQGAQLRLNCHLMFWVVRRWWNFSSCWTLFSHWAAATKVLALSEYIFSGPFGYQAFWRLCRNSPVSMDLVSSR